MADRPPDAEITRRIAAMLLSPGAGRAVSGALDARSVEWAHRTAIADLRVRRLQAQGWGGGDEDVPGLPDVPAGDGGHPGAGIRRTH